MTDKEILSKEGEKKMKIYSIDSEEFKEYGRVVDNVDFTGLLKALKATPVPMDVVYVASVPELEKTDAFEPLSTVVYGEMPIQIGYCNGHNAKLNALEYHRDSEINVAATDAILLLALKREVEKDFTLNTSKVKAFLVPAGTAVEVYATTLHYAPCGVDGKGFQVAIVLPKGTNEPLKQPHAATTEHKASVLADGALNEDALLTAVNKWLIGHAEGGLDANAFLGLKGENICIDFQPV